MKNKLTGCALALAGVLGAAVYHWALTTAFDGPYALSIPGAPALWALAAFFVLVPLGMLLLILLRPSGVQGFGVLCTERFLPTILSCLGGATALSGGALWLQKTLETFRVSYPGVIQLISPVLAILAGGGMIWMALRRLAKPRAMRAAPGMLCIGFSTCFWLTSFYQSHSLDPEIHHYCWLLLALVCAALAFVFQAQVSFDQPRRGCAAFFSGTACVYAIAALPGCSTFHERLLLLGTALWLLPHSVLLLNPAPDQPEGPALENGAKDPA